MKLFDDAVTYARSGVFAAALLAAMVPAGCNRNNPVAAARPDARPAQTFGGGPAAHPNDWCGEHGVPESQCTRCHPELEAQFRARNDWCGEHAVPESHCALCHPDIRAQGVSPASPRRAGDGGRAAREGERPERAGVIAPGTTVRFASPDVAERVGIETVSAERRALADEILVPVRIEFDPTRVARVSGRIAGVVESIAVAVGARVEQGQLLATLDSAAAAGARAQTSAARARLASAEAALRRIEALATQRLATVSDVERARSEAAAARAEVQSQSAAATVVGRGGGRMVRVVAPRAGVVVARPASLGQQVTAEEVLVEIADLSTVLAVLDIPDADAQRVRVGQSVSIEMDGAEQPLSGSVAWIAPAVDSHTRTVQARVELANPGESLRANAFGRARIAVASTATGVVVPRDALQQVEGRDVVFVRRSTTVYEPREVEVALRGAREVMLRRGVDAGEPVVTTGGFQLKTEIMRDSIGAGCGCTDES